MQSPRYPPVVQSIKPKPPEYSDIPPPCSQPRPRSPSPSPPPSYLLPPFPDGSHLFDGLDPSMQADLVQQVEQADSIDKWRRRLSQSPLPFRVDPLDYCPSARSTRPRIVLSPDSPDSSVSASPPSVIFSLAPLDDSPFSLCTAPGSRSRLASVASDISDGTRALEASVIDYNGSTVQPFLQFPVPTARHVVFDDDGFALPAEQYHCFELISRMMQNNDSDSDFELGDISTPGWSSASESGDDYEEEHTQVLDVTPGSHPTPPPKEDQSATHPLQFKKWPHRQVPGSHRPNAFLKQGLRLAADWVVDSKDMVHPIFGPFHPEEEVRPPVSDRPVHMMEDMVKAEDMKGGVHTSSGSSAAPETGSRVAEELSVASGEMSRALDDMGRGPLSQSDGKPLDCGKPLLSQTDGKPFDKPLLSQTDGKPLDCSQPLLSQSDGKSFGSGQHLLSQSDGKPLDSSQLGQSLLCESDRKPLDSGLLPSSPARRGGVGAQPTPLSPSDDKHQLSFHPSQSTSKARDVDHKEAQPSSQTSPPNSPPAEVKLERQGTPLWEYPGRPLDLEPNERLITIKSKPYGEMKVLPDAYWRATHRGPPLDDDDYDSDELLELEIGNVQDVTGMRPDPFGLMPQGMSSTMASRAETVLRSILQLARFARRPSTKASRMHQAPLTYESTVQTSAAFLPPSVVMMAEMRTRQIVDGGHGSWREPGEAVWIASEVWGPPRSELEEVSFHVKGEPLVNHEYASKTGPWHNSTPWTTSQERDAQEDLNEWFLSKLRDAARNRKWTYSAHAQMLRRKTKHGHLFRDQLSGIVRPQKRASRRVGNTIIPNAVYPSLEERLFGEDLVQKRMRRSLREAKAVFSLPVTRRSPSLQAASPRRRQRWDGRTRYPSFDAEGNPYLPGDVADRPDDSEDELSSYDGDDDQDGSDEDEGGRSDDGEDSEDADGGQAREGGDPGDDGDGSDDSDESEDSSETDEETEDEEEDSEESEESEADADAVDWAVSGFRSFKSFDDVLLFERARHVHDNWPGQDPEEYDSEVESSSLRSTPPANPTADPSMAPVAGQLGNAVAGHPNAPRKRGRPPKNKDGHVATAAAADITQVDNEPPKRGRGRPRKNPDADSEPTPRRKPGRPPKDKDLGRHQTDGEEEEDGAGPASAAPKRRGRPPKGERRTDAVSQEENTAPAAPKKRGRPPKDPGKTSAGDQEDEGGEPPKKRGPGRPRKEKDAAAVPTALPDDPPKKRGPGRPRKSENPNPPPVTPKKRGRPPKDKGKQRAETEDEEGELPQPKRVRSLRAPLSDSDDDEDAEHQGTGDNGPSVPTAPEAMEHPTRDPRQVEGGRRPFRQILDCVLLPAPRRRPAPVLSVAESPTDNSPPAKRQRGRSPKHPVPELPGNVGEGDQDNRVKEPPPKRGPGRPRKNPLPEVPPLASAAAAKSSTSPPESHRQGPTWATHNGRSSPDVDELQDSQDVVIIKRGPGRPKGSKNRPKPPADDEPIVKRKPGRPRKTAVEVAAAEGDSARGAAAEGDSAPETDVAPVKRKRGRPRKTDPGPSTADQLDQPAKRGPGRPRKTDPPSQLPTEIPAKRGPGRPRKTDAGPAGGDPPPKRGPGRPRKTNPAPPPPAETPVKRGPGRPRKVVQPSPRPSIEAVETPVKRGPGRPKGSKSVVSALSQPTTPRATRSRPHTTTSPPGTRSGGASYDELAAAYPAYYDASSKEDAFYERMDEGRDARDGDEGSSYRPEKGDDDDDDIYL